MKYMAAVLLLVAAMSAQNVPSRNKGRHLDIPAISREANGSVVSIVMSDKKGHPIAQGSGFLISKDGRVVTNYHVIKSGSSAVVKLPNGTVFLVDGMLASDKNRDVAIIKAHGSDFRALTLGDSDRLQIGEEVVAIGSPLSLESTVSNGIVSGIRTVEDEGGKFVQITAPISPGSSGGPLFNMAGEVVGITTAGLRGGENLNFAIPIDDVKHLTLVPRTEEARAFPNEANEANEAPANPAWHIVTETTPLHYENSETVNLDIVHKVFCNDGRYVGDTEIVQYSHPATGVLFTFTSTKGRSPSYETQEGAATAATKAANDIGDQRCR